MLIYVVRNVRGENIRYTFKASCILCRESMLRSFFMASVVIDAGHGGSDPGAVYNGRQEKDDVLRLARAVGEILSNSGVDVSYTRIDDRYETPFQKAMDANATGADFLVSIHRNSSATPNTYSGAQTLVFEDSGVRSELARNINNELVALGFRDAGIVERPNLVVLRRSQMPAALVEVGFINNEADNRLLDEKFNEIAQGIADGILTTIYGGQGDSNDKKYVNGAETKKMDGANNMDDMMRTVSDENNMNEDMMNNMEMNDMRRMNDMNRMNNMNMNRNVMTDEMMEARFGCCRKLYRVQVGAYRNKENADRILNTLLSEGFPAFMIFDDGLYKVQVGAFEFLPNAIRMENELRMRRYNTYITT